VAWLLTGTAAWIWVLRGDKRAFDVNAWLVLGGTNWAAVDVLRSLWAMGRIGLADPGGEATLKSHFGVFAAAYVVLLWDTLHGAWQFAATTAPALFELWFKSQPQRLWVLSVILVLPAFALIATEVFAERVLQSLYINSVRALYWSAPWATEPSTGTGFRIMVVVGLCLFNPLIMFGGNP
jgi:hypothetical protein